MARKSATTVYLEVGDKRVFACALDWPGWCRSGKDEQGALDALAAYASRYAEVTAEAGVAAPPATFEVAERIQMAALVSATWAVFDRIVASASAALRKGPRGGGRDRDKIVQHVLAAEIAYARGLGMRLREPDGRDRTAVAAHRAAISQCLQTKAEGRWPPRYAARRIAWHVLDHAWEIQDRTP